MGMIAPGLKGCLWPPEIPDPNPRPGKVAYLGKWLCRYDQVKDLEVGEYYPGLSGRVLKAITSALMIERQRKAAHAEEQARSQQKDLKIAISDAATTQGMLAATGAGRGKERILASSI